MPELLAKYILFLEFAASVAALGAVWLATEQAILLSGFFLLVAGGLVFLAQRVRRAVEKAEGGENG